MENYFIALQKTNLKGQGLLILGDLELYGRPVCTKNTELRSKRQPAPVDSLGDLRGGGIHDRITVS